MISEPLFLQEAEPVWPAGRETEMNLTVGFRTLFGTPEAGQPVTLRIAASTRYRVWLNSVFLAHGPTRGSHGWFRVDEWDLTPFLMGGSNLLAIEVAGYNVNSYAYLDQPSFLQAEVNHGEAILAASRETGGAFRAVVLPERVQRVPRYSFQRTFTEVYRLTPGVHDWRTDPDSHFSDAVLAAQPAKKLRSFYAPLSGFEVVAPIATHSSGSLQRIIPPKPLWRDRSLSGISPQFKGYAEADLETAPPIELQHWVHAEAERATGSWQILDMGRNVTGFIGMRVTCTEATTLYVTFDEILTDGDVDWKRLECVNIAAYHLAPGTYDLETFEPYTLRYLKIITLDGNISAENIFLRELACPDADLAKFQCADPQINRIFEAARETYRQNATDLFMDCPSRERAGWLCDSFFTARTAVDLSGHTRIEDIFLENFELPDHFPYLPEGMLPMCYPSDHNDGNFIPNWALWFVVQMEEYEERGGDPDLIAALEPRVQALFDYFVPYENSDGLLEGLDHWVFVEWSRANDFVQDVSYPSNMLYCGALEAAARLYQKPEQAEKAARVRQCVLDQSFDGQFFVDNAVRENGTLRVTRNRSETCQYYAFFFGIAKTETHVELWERLRDDFGPERGETGSYPDIYPAAPFIGYYLRLELLSRSGEQGQILRDIGSYFGHMADHTGTLWEHGGTQASCNHGFASHVAHVLLRDILGVRIDRRRRTITLHPPILPLAWCRGEIPLEGGSLNMHWEQRGGVPALMWSAAAGYEVNQHD